jgi:uncharacterized membrane protein
VPKLPPQGALGPSLELRHGWRWTGLLVLALTVSCGDLNSARGLPATEGVVTRVVSTTDGGPFGPLQQVEVYLPQRGVTETLYWGAADQPITYNSLLREGDHVLLTRPQNARADAPYQIADIVRVPVLEAFGALVALVLFLFARWRGLAALAGLVASVLGFFLFVVPAIQRGDDPLVGTIGVSIVVLILSVYLVHGLNRKSTVALLGALVGFALVAILAFLAISFGRISGIAGDALQIAQLPGFRGRIDLPRLALAAMMLGSLGALIDMAIGQSSATFELAAVDPDLRGWRLYGRALNVGIDHIGALINTLGFAYFAGALPLLVVLAAKGNAASLALNEEGIVFALLSTAVASVGLIACVPLTTAIAVVIGDRPLRSRVNRVAEVSGPRARRRPRS